MIYSIRVADIPKFIIAIIIWVLLFAGLISLWKSTGGMQEWVVYSLFVGILVVSYVAAHFIWKAACNAWRKNRVTLIEG
jgi:hypothetical protein